MVEEVRVLKDKPLLVQAGTQTDLDQLVGVWLVTVTLVDVLWCSQQHGTNIDEREEKGVKLG